jgi:hypothetical protein
VRISAAAILSVFVRLGGMTIGLYDSVSRRTTGSGKPLRWLLLVLLCAVLFSGCDRHVRVTKEMAWDCDPGKTDPRYPDAEHPAIAEILRGLIHVPDRVKRGS